jgi:hypothetical protein
MGTVEKIVLTGDRGQPWSVIKEKWLLCSGIGIRFRLDLVQEKKRTFGVSMIDMSWTK